MAAERRFTPPKIFLSGILLIGIASVGTLYWFSQRLTLSATDNLTFIANLKHNHIEKMLGERRADTQVVASYPAVHSLLEAGEGKPEQVAAESLRPLIESIKAAYGYTSVQVFNSSRRRMDSSSGIASPPPAEVEQAISRAHAEGRPQFVNIHRSEGGSLVFGFVQPVFPSTDPTKTPSGSVYLEVPTDKVLYTELMEWPVPSTSGESFIFRKEGNNIVYLSPLRNQSNDPLLTVKMPQDEHDLLAAKLLSLKDSSVVSGHDYRGARVVGLGREIEGTDWYLAVKIDRDEIYRPARLLAIAIAVISLFGVILFSALAAMVSRMQAERAARSKAQLDEKYRVAITNAFDAVVVLDRHGVIVEWNPATDTLLGYGPHELRGKTVADLRVGFSPGDIPVLLDRIRSEGTSRYPVQWRRKDGVVLEVDLSVTFVSDREGGDFFFASARDVTLERVAQRRLEYLNRLLALLNETNNAIRNLHDVPAILEAACAAAIGIGKFKLVWAGIPQADGRVEPVSVYGDAASYVRNIVVTTDPALATSQGPVGSALRSGQIVVVNDFQTDPRTVAWHDTAKTYGLASCVTAPIVVAGSAISAITFYAEVIDFFDSELLGLIERLQQNIALACETARFGERALTAEAKAAMLEGRYETIFESSPLAMQISHQSNDRALRINKAHQALFGYDPDDLPTEDAWFIKMYPDEMVRKSIRKIWTADVDRARLTEHGVASPLIKLFRKNGAPLIVQGKVAVAGKDVIVAWTDLTEREEQVRALREGEARFRNLIEQTITGIYVVWNRKLQFVNPRFEEISGYSAQELLGRDPAFLVADDSQTTFWEARRSLESGDAIADFTIRLRRKDGDIRDLSIHAAKSSWDGNPVIIAMSQDISERKRSEERIAAYLRQLKYSMQGTLSAVAKMLDFRDPYTAGHERRVGLISAAIGKELGLNEEACEWLNWAGLVHDIGKISVPAELLSKPAKLTRLEYEMIKEHAESGYQILKDIEFPIPIAEIARQHHERIDGSGYPRGLKGDEILLEARILAVADVIESMASHRPYRPGLGIEAALREIETHRGSYYDPIVVDALLRLINSRGWQIPN